MNILAVFSHLVHYLERDKNLNTLAPVSRTRRMGVLLTLILGFISLIEPKSPRLILVILIFSGFKNFFNTLEALSG